MAVGIYLNFRGNAGEALAFYETVFKTPTPQIMKFGDAPPSPAFQMPEEMKPLVMHADLEIYGTHIMVSDTPAHMPFQLGNNITIVVTLDDMDEIKRAFEALADGGTVQQPLQETFWSKCYGALVDRFGVGWQLSHEPKV
jgi:PhnB protein